MENPNHVKELVDISLARFIVEELSSENSKLRKKRTSLISDTNSDPLELEAVTMQLNWNLEMLNKMEIVIEMADRYKNRELPQGFTCYSEGYGLNNLANR